MTVDIRIATPDDIGALETLIERSSGVLLVPFLSPAQLAVSLEVMTLDRELMPMEPILLRRKAGSRRVAGAGPAGGAS